jgi:SPP1 gp7 family putative phage head morphogenesis protein
MSKLKIKKFKRLPKWLFPLNIERHYKNILIGYIKELNALIDEILNTQLKNSHYLFNLQRNKRLDSFSDDIDRMINSISIQLDKFWKVDPDILTYNIAKKTDEFNFEQWSKLQQKVFGITLFKNEPWLEPILKSFTKENVTLIKTLKGKVLSELEVTLNREFKKGTLYTDIRDTIQSKYKTTEWQAERIARDQIGKLNADLTEYRQEEIGVKKYTWRTSLDERVRGNPLGRFPKAIPSHWDREGKIFSWNTPPEDGHPGQAILCRCYAEPMFDTIDNI